MIRFIHCIKRQEDVSPEEFRRFWYSSEFDQLLERLSTLFEAQRVEKNLALAIEANTKMQMERGAEEPFDGIFEFWIENAKTVTTHLETDEGQAVLKDMQAFQTQFIDFAKSRRFYTEWSSDGGKFSI